ncbi:hypothetical protein V2J09_022331 [Rumex salicifolius]
MLAKTDSDASSNPGSSPARRAPSGPVYYVQSPSHDGEKTTNSFHSTPAALSPMGSPPQSRDSSSTRFSGPGRRASSKEEHAPALPRFNSIEEEEEECLLGAEEEGPAMPRRWLYALGFIVAFFVLFGFFSLVLWGASRSQKPIITMKSVRFEDFDVHAGTDGTGVATAMVTINVTLKLLYQNRGTFFGVHVAPTPVNLFHQQILVATGAIDRFYQRRKSQRAITVHVTGTSVPVYGGGSDLSSKNGAPILPVGLTLDFRVRSRAYVLGRIVKPKFYRSIECPMIMVPTKMKYLLSLKTNCTYL